MAQEWAPENFHLAGRSVRLDLIVSSKKQPRNNTARTLARVDVMATSRETPVAILRGRVGWHYKRGCGGVAGWAGMAGWQAGRALR